MAKLGEICTFQSGGTPSKTHSEYFGGNIPWVSTTALNGNVIKESDAVAWITPKAIQESAAKIVPANSIMVGTRVGIGKVAVNSVEMSTSQDVISLVGIDESKWHKPYLCELLSSKKDYFNSQARGATIKGIKIDIVANVEIPGISYAKQKHIADILYKVKCLISLRKQQLSKLDELVKARFVEMFGDAKLNPYDFPCNSLSEYILFLTSGSRGWSQYFTDSGEYFITIKNVKNCKITLQDVQYVTPPDNAEAKRTRVQENDLLISITADLGRTGIVTNKIAEHGAYINQHLTCIRLKQDKLNPLYVAYYMESDAGKEQFVAKNQSAVKAGLNFNAINSLKLMVPPLALQNQFAAFVERVDQQKQTVQQSLEKLELMKKALMQEYFG